MGLAQKARFTPQRAAVRITASTRYLRLRATGAATGRLPFFPLPRRRRTAPPKMSSVAPIGQSQPQKMRPANTASRMVNTAGKRAGITVRVTRGIAVPTRGSSRRKRSDGRLKKLPVSAAPSSRQKRNKQLACTNRLSLPPIRCPFSGYRLKRRTCMFSISMRPSPRA